MSHVQMAAPDPSAGSTFIWLVSAVLFLSVAAGGACLVLYITQPDSLYASWLPFVGVALVCLPWLFWILTCFYRVISRACGFRAATGGGRGGGGGAFEGGSARAGVEAADADAAAAAGTVETPPVMMRSPESEAIRRAQFEAILELDEQDGEEGNDEQKSRPSSNYHASSGSSAASHESEMPLASSMAS